MDKMILICQQCGGTLEITADVEIFKCKYCDTPYLIKRESGTISVIRLEKRVEKLETEQKQIRGNVASIELEKLLKDRKQFLTDWNEGALKYKYRAREGCWQSIVAGAIILLAPPILLGVVLSMFQQSAMYARDQPTGAGLLALICLGAPWVYGMFWAVRRWQARWQPARDEYNRRISEFDKREAELRAQIAEGAPLEKPG